MTTQEDFKKLALIRLESAKTLLDKEDWEGVGYFMGLSLECALKACICKTLRVSNYPEDYKEDYKEDKEIPGFFRTHYFLRLLLLSGLSDLFTPDGTNPLALKNWSSFTVQYPGSWIGVRYVPNYFNDKNIPQLYGCLFLDENSIIKIIDKEKRW